MKSSEKYMTFYPSEEEFKDFDKYIKYIESLGAHKIGIAKIVPPASWVPRKNGYSDMQITIPAPIKQSMEGAQGKYQCTNEPQPPITLQEFETLANSSEHKPPDGNNMEGLERKFWKNILFNPAIYGADVSGSLFDEDQRLWNPACLPSLLQHVVEDYNTTIEGVTTSYLYFGAWRSTFAWHTEDMDLYSINFLHFGAPKFWYCIPPSASRKFERLVSNYYPVESKQCSNFLRHKSTIISPSLLKLNHIPFVKLQQSPRDIIITFPFAYHSGFNTGFNCAESTNFATKRWIEYGKRTLQCDCRQGMVRFSMKCFVKRYQPHLYSLFLQNLDLAPHPEDSPGSLRKIKQQLYHDQDFIITDAEDILSKRLIRTDSPQKINNNNILNRNNNINKSHTDNIINNNAATNNTPGNENNNKDNNESSIIYINNNNKKNNINNINQTSIIRIITNNDNNNNNNINNNNNNCNNNNSNCGNVIKISFTNSRFKAQEILLNKTGTHTTPQGVAERKRIASKRVAPFEGCSGEGGSKAIGLYNNDIHYSNHISNNSSSSSNNNNININNNRVFSNDYYNSNDLNRICSNAKNDGNINDEDDDDDDDDIFSDSRDISQKTFNNYDNIYNDNNNFNDIYNNNDNCIDIHDDNSSADTLIDYSIYGDIMGGCVGFVDEGEWGSDGVVAKKKIISKRAAVSASFHNMVNIGVDEEEDDDG